MRQRVEFCNRQPGNWMFSGFQSFRSCEEGVNAQRLSTGYFCIGDFYSSTFERLTFFYKTELLSNVRASTESTS